METREGILYNFAIWTVVSAARSGCPLKSKEEILSTFNFFEIFIKCKKGWQSRNEFDIWHKKTLLKIQKCNGQLNVGWIAKLLNVFLKTLIYVGGVGDEINKNYIHPPIDRILLNEIKKSKNIDTKNKSDILKVNRIKDIKDYELYTEIIHGLQNLAQVESIKLIEVEKYWDYAYNKLHHAIPAIATASRV